MAYNYICQNCGNPFESVHKNTKYCSRACYKPPGKKSSFTEEQEVELCKLYTTPNEDGLYMGTDAIAEKTGINKFTIIKILKRRNIPRRPKSWYVQNQPHHNLTRIPQGEAPLCKCGCGQPVEWLRKKDRWARYIKGHYTQKGEQNQRWNGGPKILICEQCGKPFQDWEDRQYCSNECSGIAKRSPHYEGRERWIKWSTIRAQIRKRDNWTCQDCGFYGKGIKRAIHVHHKDGNPKNNENDNLVCLCAKCHLKAHGCNLPDDWEYDGVEFP